MMRNRKMRIPVIAVVFALVLGCLSVQPSTARPVVKDPPPRSGLQALADTTNGAFHSAGVSSVKLDYAGRLLRTSRLAAPASVSSLAQPAAMSISATRGTKMYTTKPGLQCWTTTHPEHWTQGPGVKWVPLMQLTKWCAQDGKLQYGTETWCNNFGGYFEFDGCMYYATPAGGSSRVIIYVWQYHFSFWLTRTNNAVVLVLTINSNGVYTGCWLANGANGC